MSWAARILLVGILVITIISLISVAITFAAPYLAAIIVLFVAGKWLMNTLDRKDPS